MWCILKCIFPYFSQNWAEDTISIVVFYHNRKLPVCPQPSPTMKLTSELYRVVSRMKRISMRKLFTIQLIFGDTCTYIKYLPSPGRISSPCPEWSQSPLWLCQVERHLGHPWTRRIGGLYLRPLRHESELIK